MFRKRKQKTTTFNNAIALHPAIARQTAPAQESDNITATAPSAFGASLSTSFSIFVISGVLNWVYGGEGYTWVVWASLLPWLLYAGGRLLYLLFILFDDIRWLLPERPEKQGLLTIIKED